MEVHYASREGEKSKSAGVAGFILIRLCVWNLGFSFFSCHAELTVLQLLAFFFCAQPPFFPLSCLFFLELPLPFTCCLIGNKLHLAFPLLFFFFWNTLTFNYQTVFLVFVIITIIIVIIFLCLTSAPILVSVAPVFVFKHSCPSFSEFALQEKQAPLFPPDPNTLSGGFFFFIFVAELFSHQLLFFLYIHTAERN